MSADLKFLKVLFGVALLCFAGVYSQETDPDEEVEFISRDPNHIKFYLFPNAA